MKFVKASEFKAGCEAVANDVLAASGAVLVVKNGKPVSSYNPLIKKRFKIGENLGGITVLGDIVSPIPGVWKAWKRKLGRTY